GLVVCSLGLAARFLIRIEGVGASSLLAANDVDRAAMDERQDPGARLGALGEEAAGRAPDGEKRLLNRVLGESGVADDAHGKPVGGAAVAIVELSQRLLVPAGNERKQGIVRKGRVIALRALARSGQDAEDHQLVKRSG